MMQRTGLAALALVLGLTAGTSAATAATTWDYYSFTGVTHPITKFQMGFADEVKKRTNGELNIVVRPAGELPFRATEAVKIAGQGQVQLSSGYAGFIAGTLPIASLSTHAYLLRSFEDVQKAWPIIDKYTAPEFKKLNVKTLYWFSWPPQNMFGVGEPITTLEAFKGRKIRSTSPLQAEMLRRVGASTVTLTTAEVPVAMERGLMEGVLTANFNLTGAKWDEFVEWAWYSDVHIAGPNYELVNLDAYNALPDNVRKTLDEVAAEWTVSMTEGIAKMEIEAKEQIAKGGRIKQIESDPKEVAKITDLVAPFWDEWAKSEGETATKMMAEIRALLGR
jgi:TRAP-type transport system periplasmic protein